MFHMCHCDMVLEATVGKQPAPPPWFEACTHSCTHQRCSRALDLLSTLHSGFGPFLLPGPVIVTGFIPLLSERLAGQCEISSSMPPARSYLMVWRKHRSCHNRQHLINKRWNDVFSCDRKHDTSPEHDHTNSKHFEDVNLFKDRSYIRNIHCGYSYLEHQQQHISLHGVFLAW